MTQESHIAPGCENSENEETTASGTWLAAALAERHALFEDVTTAVRDEDDLPAERGASGANLRWSEVLGDPKLDQRVRRAAWRLQKKHSISMPKRSPSASASAFTEARRISAVRTGSRTMRRSSSDETATGRSMPRSLSRTSARVTLTAWKAKRRRRDFS